MAPPPSSLYTLSFLLALLATLLVASTLRLLAILPRAIPHQRGAQTSTPKPTLHPRLRPAHARILVVLGSGGHTHEMLALLRDLDTRKYVHRTYVVSSGDDFSAQRAVAFEAELEAQAAGSAGAGEKAAPRIVVNGVKEDGGKSEDQRGYVSSEYHVGPAHYTIATIPRARRIHQPLYSTPFSALRTLIAAFNPLLSCPSSNPPRSASTAPTTLPHLILTNGPATAVLVILAAFLLRFFDIRGAQSRGLCRTIYVESFARVKTLSLSGRLVVRVVDRFLVQWEALEGYAGRAEFGGVLV